MVTSPTEAQSDDHLMCIGRLILMGKFDLMCNGRPILMGKFDLMCNGRLILMGKFDLMGGNHLRRLTVALWTVCDSLPKTARRHRFTSTLDAAAPAPIRLVEWEEGAAARCGMTVAARALVSVERNRARCAT